MATVRIFLARCYQNMKFIANYDYYSSNFKLWPPPLTLSNSRPVHSHHLVHFINASHALIIELKKFRLWYLYRTLPSRVALARPDIVGIKVGANGHHIIIFPSYNENLAIVSKTKIAGSSLLLFHGGYWTKRTLLYATVSNCTRCTNPHTGQIAQQFHGRKIVVDEKL